MRSPDVPFRTRPSENWIRTYQRGGDYAEALNGVPWHDAPLPSRWHACKAQTRGWLGLNYTERCACGAIRMSSGDPWSERNQTRKSRARKRAEDRLPRVDVICTECGTSYEAARGTPRALDRLCDPCWAGELIATRRPE